MSAAIAMNQRQMSQDQRTSRHTKVGWSSWASSPQYPSSTEETQKFGPDHEDQAVHDLARIFTSRSQQLSSPFSDQDNRLDPTNEGFRSREWAKAFYNLRYSGDASPRVAGVAFKGLNVWGKGSPTDFQTTVGNAILKLPSLFGRGSKNINILQDCDGLVLPGEQLCVLGPPGSGCSTLLKTIAGETHGFQFNPEAFNYQGIPAKDMSSAFRGEAFYTAEVDAHYPQLTVGTTLYFAALARTPRQLPDGVTRAEYATHLRDVIMAMFVISHTVNTRVGNDFVRGVSGGERKRVTIGEATLSFAPLQCWDNSTRGLDSANAVEFCRTLRTLCDVFNTSSYVAIYQAPQAAYDLFDKVIVLYEGRQIFFGPAQEGRKYFQRLGFFCPESQTTPDFLTSMTSASERKILEGYEDRAPRTSEEFSQRWKSSSERATLLRQIEQYNQDHPLKGDDMDSFAHSRNLEKSTKQRQRSPYTLSYWRQISICMWRELQRLKGDPSVPCTIILTNFVEALIISSIFYNLSHTTASFFQRGAVLFMTVLLNAFGSMLEIMSLYAKRTIVEKHNRYALYHPSAEALASMIMDMPYKISNAIVVNTTLYFMSNLRREPGPFFFFLLNTFSMTMSMSMFFRLFASMTKTLAQALAPSAIILILVVIYAGFAIPVDDMLGWASWIRWLNPVSYGFEAVLVNEFHQRTFDCADFVPAGPDYESVTPEQRVCAVEGAVAGADTVGGTAFVETVYGYQWGNRWRNFGILIAFTVGLFMAHLIMSELVASERSKGEVLVFRRSKMQKKKTQLHTDDEANANAPPGQPGEKSSPSTESHNKVQKAVSIFHWEKVNYEVQIKGETRKILDGVDGWIKPGTLTALMGVSGAGKTTLLDVLASRTTMGVFSGNMLVDGRDRDESFQRQTGYVMQQDIHHETSTLREALEFSALLRQPAEYTREERLAYVDHVISLLEMEEYADAVVGVQGSGLNVEQRKRLTIGVELAARPKLLLFLDEPTSGLDSQTSWSICDLMEKLTKNGQTILCTVHQPSSLLFQRFDRLLLLAKGGRTVYFGEIGENSHVLVEYFESNGGTPVAPGANPAEYMLKTIGAAPGASTEIDWPSVWKQSPQYAAVQEELGRLRTLADEPSAVQTSLEDRQRTFAVPFWVQLQAVVLRVAQQYWRSPSYIYSKVLLTVGCSLLIGFSFFMANNTAQGLQNQMFGVFIFLFIVLQLILQIFPLFVVQRTLYEARERQSKTYAWPAFVISNIVVEMGWNAIVAILSFLAWYYPAGLYRNAKWTDSLHLRSFHTLVVVLAAFTFASSFAHLLISGSPSEEVAGALAMLLSIMLYAFCGILAGPDAFPGFWIFMYRVNPFTYLVSSFMSASLGEAPAYCSDSEFQIFDAPSGNTCGMYLESYVRDNGGYILDADATGECNYCQFDNTNEFLASINVDWDTRWRDFGLLWVYVAFNVAGAIALYWMLRVPKGSRKSKAK